MSDGSGAATLVRKRNAASVSLRQRSIEEQEQSASLDPATKSLADALRITYRLLQAAMVILVVLYLLSGFQSVKESERGIRLTFGQVAARDLPPGFQFSLPAPFGELVKVQTGVQTEAIDKQFFPRLSEAEEKMLVDKDKGPATLVGGGDSLDPDADGQLLTADGNIAHSRWSVTYQRAEASKSVANIDPDFERRIVYSAACRGIVQAAASLPIDDLLKKQSESGQAGQSRVEMIASQVAQKALDEMDSGIQITELKMSVVIPPRNVMSAFQDVSAAQSKAGQEIQNAQTERNEKLTQAAGEAAPLLLGLIDRYETDLARGEAAKSSESLELIDKVLQHEEVEVESFKSDVRVAGAVSQIIDEARQYRTSAVNRAKADADLFETKRALFRSNPMVMVNGEWSDAFTAFLASETVQAMYLPPDVARHVLLINRDPSITRDIQQKMLLKENEAAQQDRINKRERERFEQRMDAGNKVREQ
jgi:membrane protease subunit HflK